MPKATAWACVYDLIEKTRRTGEWSEGGEAIITRELIQDARALSKGAEKPHSRSPA